MKTDLPVLFLCGFSLFQAFCEVRSKLNKLTGLHVHIGVYEQATSLKFIRSPNGKIVGYSGPVYEILKWLSARLDFQYTIIPVETETLLVPLPNGTWTGVFELIRKQEIDFIMNGLVTTSTLFAVLDYTASIVEEPNIIIMPLPKAESRLYAPIKPFSLSVWLLFIGAVMCVCLVLYAVFTVADKKHKKRTDLGDLVFRSSTVVLGQDGFPSVGAFKSTPKRLVIGMWCLAAIIFVNLYTSGFIAFATTPKLVHLPESWEELAYSEEVHFIASKYSNLGPLLNAETGFLKQIGDFLRENQQNILPGLQNVTNVVATGCCVMLYPKFLLELLLYTDYKKTGKCRCSLSQTPQLWDYYSFGVQKNSSYNGIFSKEILSMKEFGLVNHWRQPELQRPYKCLKVEKPKVAPLKLRDLASAFIVLAAGIVVSVSVFIIEIVLTKIRPKS